ncbi:MAG: [citrate (pro-3S)-lyase] ligase [Treponema sp.]|jgi:[citrate (pro-3S)-lyase] ligase|nr:[citrate (pro-3S)-lyase] ligase [Treponema sp.]
MSCGYPFRGAALEKLRDFLRDNGLDYDDRIEFSVCLMDGEAIAAAGSIGGGVLRCVAAARDRQNEGLAASVVTELIHHAAREGRHHLFLFTKPGNGGLFSNLGFYPVAETGEALLMENKKEGVRRFVASLSRPGGKSAAAVGKGAGAAGAAGTGVTGAIVANCNPFTLGHLYLVETAARECDALHLFILSEDKSEFSVEVRRELALRGTAHIPNVIVQPTGPYLVSGVTFPDYFLKDSASPEAVNTELDLTIFARHFADPLGITRRYVGAEPLDPVTAAYNRQMRRILPRYGIQVAELLRLEQRGAPVSAGRVRRLLGEKNFAALKELVPPASFDYLVSRYGGKN